MNTAAAPSPEECYKFSLYTATANILSLKNTIQPSIVFGCRVEFDSVMFFSERRYAGSS